jgi:hypothetical protein
MTIPATQPTTQHYPAPSTSIVDTSPAKRSQSSSQLTGASTPAKSAYGPVLPGTSAPSVTTVSSSQQQQQRAAQPSVVPKPSPVKPPTATTLTTTSTATPTTVRQHSRHDPHDDDDPPEGIPVVGKHAPSSQSQAQQQPVAGSVPPTAAAPGFFGRWLGGGTPTPAPQPPQTQQQQHQHQAPSAAPSSAKRAPTKTSTTAMQTLPSSGHQNTGHLPSAGPGRGPPVNSNAKRAPQSTAPPVNTRAGGGGKGAAQPKQEASPRTRHKREPSSKDVANIPRHWPIEEEVRNRMIDYHQQNEIRCLVQHYAEQAMRSISNTVPKVMD